MVCEKSNDLMMRYMDGLLDDFDKMNLDKHIQTCKTCREDFAMYSEILQGIGSNLEVVEAPEGFAHAVMTQIDGINIYFPAKVRNKGKIVDNILFAVWGVVAIAFSAGLVMFLAQYHIFAWLDANGLTATSAALRPFADRTTQFGTAAAAYTADVLAWLMTTISTFWPALVTAFGGFVALAILAMKISPKYSKTLSKQQRSI